MTAQTGVSCATDQSDPYVRNMQFSMAKLRVSARVSQMKTVSKTKTETLLCASVKTFTLKPVMKAQRDSRGVAVLVFNLGARWV